MRIAERVSRLGTETAFAVSAEAAAFAAQGNKVYPFHLGDMNIPTPANIVEAAIKAMKDGKTGYCPNAGIPQLRETLAADVSASRGLSYTMENVTIQPGGKPTINKFFLALMNPDDEVLYPNPGYPIYESQIEFQGGKGVPYGYIEGKENFELDMDAIEGQITPRTKLLVLNDLQNPTGAECSFAELERLAELVLKHDLYVLCDEAYFDIRYEGKSSSLASLPGMAKRCVILYTFSKKFAMTGWRLGAAIGPKEIIDVITKLNVNDESCSNHFIQYAAIEGLTGDQTEAKQILATLKERRDTAVDILNSIDGVHCFRPNATFYLFPNVTGAMKKKNLTNYDAFRKTL
ncbi:MAG: aminotransferase class I/II-fold pyridoxal phosphate-dependent enzyme, partial [Desulfobacterales bacterium]|nr:aminotransferase class I/II-fold pyridoxal phosphate-dependent enzyme [Desulfobacterales bacterium]